MISIKSNNGTFDSEISIIDVHGKTVFEISVIINSISKSLELKSIAKGIYFLKIKTGNQIETHKLIKQ